MKAEPPAYFIDSCKSVSSIVPNRVALTNLSATSTACEVSRLKVRIVLVKNSAVGARGLSVPRARSNKGSSVFLISLAAKPACASSVAASATSWAVKDVVLPSFKMVRSRSDIVLRVCSADLSNRPNLPCSLRICFSNSM